MGLVRISVDGGRCAWLDDAGWTVSVRGTDAAGDAADGGGEGVGLEVGESESAGACGGSRARGGVTISAPPVAVWAVIARTTKRATLRAIPARAPATAPTVQAASRRGASAGGARAVVRGRTRC